MINVRHFSSENGKVIAEFNALVALRRRKFPFFGDGFRVREGQRVRDVLTQMSWLVKGLEV